MAVDFTLRNNITEVVLTSIMQYGAALLAFQTEGTATCFFHPDDIMDYEETIHAFQDDIVNRVHAFDDLAFLYAAEYAEGLGSTSDCMDQHLSGLQKWLRADWQRRAAA